MDRRSLIEKIESFVRPIISNLGFGLVNCEYLNDQGRWVLRLYIDKVGGQVTTGDCVIISHAVEGVLDVENVIHQRYYLEVSSPGLDRILRQFQDFEKYAGKDIRLKTSEPLNGRSNFYGRLNGIKEEDIIMTVDGVEYKIPFDKIAKARVVPKED